MIQVLLVTICLAALPYQGSSIMLESGKVNDYEVVYPQRLAPLPEGAVQQKYEDTMQYEFKVNGETIVLHLEKNKGLFSKDYSETHYSPDGRKITTYPSVEDHCYYHGRIENYEDSTASISACNGLKGHFKIQGETYFIESLKLSDSEAHAVLKYENVGKEDETHQICGVTLNWKSYDPIKRPSRLNLTPKQQTWPQTSVNLQLIVDHSMYAKYNSNSEKITKTVQERVNIMKEIFKPLNFDITLSGIEMWDKKDLITVKTAATDTLKLFAKWRQTDLLKRIDNDNAQLQTAVDFDGETVGLAFKSTMCDKRYSAGIIQDHSAIPLLMAVTIAHELGHNLGMDHDDTSKCNCNVCIMAPRLNTNPSKTFSDCSNNDYQKFLTDKKPKCIHKKSLKTDTVSTSVSGNEPLDDNVDGFHA
uniref:Snake venom metalloproteinase acutolysin-C n=1 Tax=Deinagkistrodon acutus TaxID=36307 RepID=VM1AC_DEIAC|nr:RecName: Full=Snake venom metalloproteinase acutolysin-C; Short=SVMP; Flags: Precursor [Deinagkistrodon acutus]AAD51823.1 acutolysin F [Deinagkistrodon acutus]